MGIEMTISEQIESAFDKHIDSIKEEMGRIQKSLNTGKFSFKSPHGIKYRNEWLNSKSHDKRESVYLKFGAWDRETGYWSDQYIKEVFEFWYCYVLSMSIEAINLFKAKNTLKATFYKKSTLIELLEQNFQEQFEELSAKKSGLAYHMYNQVKPTLFFNLFNNKIDVILDSYTYSSKHLEARKHNSDMHSDYPFDLINVIEWMDMEIISQKMNVVQRILSSDIDAETAEKTVYKRPILTLRQKLMLIEELGILEKFPENNDGDLNKNRAAEFLSVLINHHPDNIRKALSDYEKNNIRNTALYKDNLNLIKPYLNLLG